MRISISNAGRISPTRLVTVPNEASVAPESQVKMLSLESLPPSALQEPNPDRENLEESLFDNRATIKVLTSRVSMHLTQVVREDLFKQIDELLDPGAWDDDSSLIVEESFLTFLRFLFLESGLQRPALSVSFDGNVMASWISTEGRLTVEFLKRDQVRLVAHHPSERGEVESIAFEGSIKSVETVLHPIGAVGLYRGKA